MSWICNAAISWSVGDFGMYFTMQFDLHEEADLLDDDAILTVMRKKFDRLPHSAKKLVAGAPVRICTPLLQSISFVVDPHTLTVEKRAEQQEHEGDQHGQVASDR